MRSRGSRGVRANLAAGLTAVVDDANASENNPLLPLCAAVPVKTAFGRTSTVYGADEKAWAFLSRGLEWKSLIAVTSATLIIHSVRITAIVCARVANAIGWPLHTHSSKDLLRVASPCNLPQRVAICRLLDFVWEGSRASEAAIPN